jgi:hypothetical protein
MSSTEPSSDALQRLFLDPDAQLGQTWLHSARIPFSKDSLHSLVLASKTPSIAKARATYGHFRMASQMHKVSGTYWKRDQELASFLQQEPIRLNPSLMQDNFACLASLRKEAIGGLLLVTQQYSSDGAISEPYITVVAAPSLATLGQFSLSVPAGLLYSDFWDGSVLAGYGLPTPAGLHCPILTATEGFSRAIKLPGVVDLFTELQPMLFPFGEQLAAPVKFPTGRIYRSFFLPEVCGLPLGMAWPMTLSFADFYASIFSLKSAYAHFLPVLTTLRSELTLWLEAVQLDPLLFVSPYIPFLEVHDSGYPDIETGVAPEALVNSKAFSPLHKMVHGFLWRLTCDSMLATGTIEAQKHLQTFLSRGETAITASSYFVDHIPGRLCPNFAYHFQVVACWPTCIDPLADLAKLPLVLARAQEYAPMAIDLHIPIHLPLTLVTHDCQLSESHKWSTPRFSYPSKCKTLIMTMADNKN